MRVVFFGTPELAVPYLDAICAAGHEVLAVVTQPDRPAARGRRLRPSPVKQAALQRGLRVLEPQKASDRQFIAGIRQLALDVGVVVAYGQILRPALLQTASLGFVNVHYSLLPELRGAAPVFAALRAGLTETGVTVQYMAEQLDAGDIILQRVVPILEDDDQGTLTARLTAVGVELLVQALELLAEGRAPRVPQEHARATMVGRIEPEDCRIDWTWSAAEIRNLVRACTPWPGAWCMWGGRRLRVERVAIVQNDLKQGGEPGEVVEIDRRWGPVIGTGAGYLVIEQLRPEGRRSMTGAEFLRGAHMQVGDRLS